MKTIIEILTEDIINLQKETIKQNKIILKLYKTIKLVAIATILNSISITLIVLWR